MCEDNFYLSPLISALMLKIYMDYREPKIDALLENFDVEIANLPVGDYLLQMGDYGVLVERKSSLDFVSSIKNNRLWDQMQRMLADEVMNIFIKRRALVIHGFLSDPLFSSGFGWNHIMGALMEIQYKYRIPVFYAEDDDALVEFFRILAKREIEGKNEGEIEKRWSRIPPKRFMSEREWKLYVLSSFPNIGPKLAEELLERFGTIEKIARANILELKKIPGVGEKKAKSLYKIFH